MFDELPASAGEWDESDRAASDDAVPPWDDAAFEAALEAHLASMTAAERADREFGLDVGSDAPVFDQTSTEAVAIAAQQLLEQLDGITRIADARRTAALLTAYEHSIEDLRVRFGSDIGHRGGLGAQTFFRTTGLTMRLHPKRVAHLVDTAMTLRDDLPSTWAVFQAGGTTWAAVDTAVQQAQGLSRDRWAAYDEVAAAKVVTSTRLKRDLQVARERLQDDTAAPRARAAASRRSALFEQHADGQASLTFVGPAAALTAIDQALSKAAIASHHDGEQRGIGQLRFEIARDLLTGGLGLHPDPACTCTCRTVPDRARVDVQLILTVPALAWLGRTAEQATLAGYGPIDLDTAKALAGQAKSFVRVLTDPVTGVRLTADGTSYRPPADLKRWIRIRDQHCRFPGCTRPAHLCDLDHVTEWQHGGVTSDANLVALDRPHHLAKSARLWQQELLADGAVDWVDPWGRRFTDPPPDPLDPAPDPLDPAPAAAAPSDSAPPRRSATGDDEPPPF